MIHLLRYADATGRTFALDREPLGDVATVELRGAERALLAEVRSEKRLVGRAEMRCARAVEMEAFLASFAAAVNEALGRVALVGDDDTMARLIVCAECGERLIPPDVEPGAVYALNTSTGPCWAHERCLVAAPEDPS